MRADCMNPQEDEGMEAFTDFCKREQPKVPEHVEMYFNGVTVFPPENETLLQAYLYFNVEGLFPQARELLLYERPPDRDGHQNKGKVDFVYRTDDGLLLIETKYLHPKYHSMNEAVSNRKGRTKRRKKNSDRNKVVKQALENRALISKEWGIPEGSIACAILTNDDNMEARTRENGILHGHVRKHDLDRWRGQRIAFLENGKKG
jgi:hypothetical protein